MADGTRLAATEKMESQLHQLQQIATTTRERLMEMIQKQDEQGRLLKEQQRTIIDWKKSSEEFQFRMDQSFLQIREGMRVFAQKVQFNFGEAPILTMGDDTRWQAMEERRRRNETQLQSLQQLVASPQRAIQDSAKRQTTTIRKIDTLTGGEATETGESAITSVEKGVLGEGSESAWVEGNADKNPEIEGISKDLCFPIQYESSRAEGLSQPLIPENEVNLEDLEIVSDESKVNLKSRALNELDELVNLLIELMELRLANYRKVGRTDSSTNPVGCLGNFSACKVFVEMPSSIGVDCCLDFDSFEPKPVSFDKKIKPNIRNWPYDRGKFDIGSRGMRTAMAKVGHSRRDRHLVLGLVGNDLKSLPFDRGWIVVNRVGAHRILSCMMTFDPGGCDPAIGRSQRTLNRCGAERMGMYWLSDCILTFDPGGVGFRGQEAAIGSVNCCCCHRFVVAYRICCHRFAVAYRMCLRLKFNFRGTAANSDRGCT